MGLGLINRITVKKDGVYISTHSSNDSSPFRSVKIPLLTDAYKRGGQKELDYELVKLLFENSSIRGEHESVLRYRNLHQSKAWQEFVTESNNAWDKLSDEDKNAVFGCGGKVGFSIWQEDFREKTYRKIVEELPKVTKRLSTSKQFIAAADEISQLLQDNGFDEASRFIDCTFDL